MKIKLLIVATITFLASTQTALAHEEIKKESSLTTKQVFIKQLANDSDYQPLLEGGKDSVKMESGRVVKLHGQKGTPHSTKTYEEILVILKGKGTVNIEGKDYFVKEGEVLYIPPHHNHQVTNNQSRKFEYIYVAAPAVEGELKAQ